MSAEVVENTALIGLHDTGRASILLAVSAPLIGKKLKLFREELGLRQVDLAKQIDVTQSRISDWERGRYNSLDLKSLLRIAVAMRWRLDDLVSGVDQEYDALVRLIDEERGSVPSRHTDGPLSRRLPANRDGGHDAGSDQTRVFAELEELRKANDALRGRLADAQRLAGEIFHSAADKKEARQQTRPAKRGKAGGG